MRETGKVWEGGAVWVGQFGRYSCSGGVPTNNCGKVIGWSQAVWNYTTTLEQHRRNRR